MAKYTKVPCQICQNFNSSIFKDLATTDLTELDGLKKTVFFKKGDVMIEEGQSSKGVFCLKTGKAKLFTRGFNGKEQILNLLQKGDVIGYQSLISGSPFTSSVVALEDTITCFIPGIYFAKLLTTNPQLNNEIMKIALRELEEAGKQITSLAQKTVRERLADELVHLEDYIGVDSDGYIDVSLTREEIANLIGTATESAIRLVSEFKSDKLIEVKGRRFKLINTPRLKKMSAF